MQLDHVLKNRPCESGKEKLEIAEAILSSDFLEVWKIWRKTEYSKEKEGSFKKRNTGEVYKKKYKKYAARKQKAYMRVGLINPKSLSNDAMSSILKILNYYLTSFPFPDNKLFSIGDLIKIILSMFPKF